MAWSYYNDINAAQGGWDGNTAWPTAWTYQRNMKGRVEMRLTDVTITEANTLEAPYGRFRDPATLRVRLLNSAGSPITAWADVRKYWGVTGAWTYLGFVSPAKSVRLETAAFVMTGSGGPVNRVSWRADIRFDGASM